MTKEEKIKVMERIRGSAMTADKFVEDAMVVSLSSVHESIFYLPETPAPSPYAVTVEVPEPLGLGACHYKCPFVDDNVHRGSEKSHCRMGWAVSGHGETDKVYPGPGCPRYVELQPVDPIMEMYNPSDSLTEEQKVRLDNLNHELHAQVSDIINSKNLCLTSVLNTLNHIHNRAKEVLGCE